MVLFCGVTSCTTKKNTFFYRAYHGTTTRFNIYFNGNESYKEAVERIDNSVKDNYTAILPVFPRPPKTEALKESPKLDRAIEKCSKAIKKHSMFIKGVEHCKPIPSCYLLMGKSYYQRQDFSDAMSVFSYITHTHTNSNIWADVHAWKAQTNLALNRIEEAEVCIEEGRQPVENSKNKRHKLHWEATYSEFLLTQKNYEQAIISLNEVLSYKRKMKKDFRTRIHFILAQTYQNLGQPSSAAEHYAIVLKRNPAYEMDFNAVINLVLCGGDDKDKNTAKTKLKKMLKDERNDTYKDQIFYALAKLDLREEKTEDAIKNLTASVYWSIDNVFQKTLSALELAELYFNRNQFIESQTYYDTVVNIIPTTFPNYTEIKAKAVILKNLVENLMLVNTQDSLQRIARMDAQERMIYIDKLIAEYNEREAKRVADEEEIRKIMEKNEEKRNSSRQSSSSSSAWFFYNPNLVKSGMQAFRKRWGNRNLEDYWFLKDVQVLNFAANNTATNTEDETDTQNSDNQQNAGTQSIQKTSDPQDRNYYLQDVPFTKEQMQASNELIATGLFYSGMIYSDDLYDYEKAVKQWEEFLRRFPEHKLVAPIYFQLYETYAHLKDMEKSDYYKNLILEQYPNTNYARIIQNPDYYKEVAAKQKESSDFYTAVYEAYTKKNYANTVALASEGLQKYPFPTLAPKFDYLKAISLGKIYGNDTLIPLLTEIIRNYPATEIDTAATDLLEILKKMQSSSEQAVVKDSAAGQVQVVKPVYTYDDKNLHFVIILANIKEVKIDQLKGHLHGFNTEFFRLQKFDISSFYLDNDNVTQMVTVSKFDNKEKAMDYYNLLKTDTKYVGYLKDAPSTKIYVISDVNYPIIYHQKDKRGEYDAFFKENYLK